jgi:hypothetical protein
MDLHRILSSRPGERRFVDILFRTIRGETLLERGCKNRTTGKRDFSKEVRMPPWAPAGRACRAAKYAGGWSGAVVRATSTPIANHHLFPAQRRRRMPIDD